MTTLISQPLTDSQHLVESTRIAAAAYGAQGIKALLNAGLSNADLVSGTKILLERGGFTAEQATQFVAKYTPVAALDQDGAGAVIFRENSSGSIAIGVRGTDKDTAKNLLQDVAADLVITANRLPEYQTTLIANFVLRETTPSDQVVVQFALNGARSSLADAAAALAGQGLQITNPLIATAAGAIQASQPLLTITGQVNGTGRALGECANVGAHSEAGPEATVIGVALAQCARVTTVNSPGTSLAHMQALTNELTAGSGRSSVVLATQEQLNIHTTGVSIIDDLNGGLPGTSVLLNIPTSLGGVVGSHSSLVAMNAAEYLYNKAEQERNQVYDAFRQGEIDSTNQMGPNGQPLGTRVDVTRAASETWRASSVSGQWQYSIDIKNGDGSTTRIDQQIDKASGKVVQERVYENANAGNPSGYVLTAILDHENGTQWAVNRLTGKMEYSVLTASAVTQSPGNSFQPLHNSGTQGNSYTIQSGDSLWKIGKSFGLSDGETTQFIRDTEAAARASGSNGNVNDLKPGNTLALPQWVRGKLEQQATAQDVTNPASANAVNGSDLQSDQYTPPSQQASSDFEQALLDAFQNPQVPAEPGTQYADAGSNTASDAGGASNAPAPPASAADDVNGSDLQSDLATAERMAQLQAAAALGLVNSIIGLQNWSAQSDLSHLSTAIGLYNQLNHISGGALGSSTGLGNLGQLGAGLGFLSALESGNVGGIVANGVALGNAVFDGAVSNAISSALGIQAGNVVPGIGLLIALDSGDPLSIASAALAFVPGWGQAAAIFLSIAGSMFESDIPMKEGQAHAQWDEAGNTQVITDQDTEGGGATAAGWMNSIVNGLQQQLAATQDAAGNSYALIPNLLPAIGYQYDADGFNYGVQGHLYLKWTDENGQSQTRYYDGQGNREDGTGETLAGDFMQHAQGAIAPAWQVQTVLAHWQQGQGITLPEQQASLPQELADGIHQTLQALTLELPNPATLTNSLIDIDADGYLEQTQWLASNQQILAIDANGDNQIGAGELLHLSGGAALNSLSWLDADGNKVLNASDPAFGALRLWIDMASDGNSSGETQSLSQAGITAIDFGSNPPAVVRSDGSRTGLTAQTLTGDVLGVRYTATVGGVLESKERGETVLHAVNTRQFDGQAGHMHGGGLDTDGADGATITVRAGDNRLSSTSANTLTTGTFKSTQTSTSLGAGDARIQAGAAGQALSGQAAVQTAGNAQVRSNPIAFVPLGAASAMAETRQVLDAMVRSATPALFDTAVSALPLTAMALGAAAVQWPSLASANAPSAPSAAALAPATVQASDAINWQALEGSRVSVATGDGLLPSSGGASATGTALASGLPTAAAAEVDASNHAPAQYLSAQTAINSVAVEAPLASGSSVSPASPSALSGLSEAAPSLPAASSGTLIDYPQVQGEQSEAVEDTVRRFTEAWLLANDSTVNAPAWPGEPSLRITSVFAPVHGSVSLQTNAAGETELVFLPEANYHGPASFSYTVTDQYGLSSNASVSLEVAAVNDAPVTVGEAANGDEDHTLQFSAASLLANDLDVDSAVDGDALRITRVGGAQHGQVFLAPDGTVSFIPDANYNGPAQFTYWVGDRDPAQIAANGAGEGYETPATVNLIVLPVNDLPVVLGEVMESDEDIVLDINPALLLANDSDVDTATTNAEPAQVLSITAVSNAQHGSITLLADGTLRFTPERDYFGAAGFSYTVDDGHGGLVVGQVVVNLAPVNDAPDVLGETVSFNEDEVQTITQASLLANDLDVDNPHTDLRIVAVDNATHGTVALNPDGSIRFAPDADYFGAASFTYTVSDGVGGFTVGTATLDILPVNDAPRLTGESLTTDEDQIVSMGLGTLLANDHDVDNLHTDLSITAATMDPASSAAGTVQIVAGEIVFTPTLNYFGQASFNYTVSDGVGGQSQAVVNLTFNSVNDAPVVNNELLMGKRDVTYTLSQAALLANDTDVESPNGLQIVAIQNVQNGTASLAANGAVTFAPTAGYAGRGRFDYVVQDADGGQTVGTAEIDFAAINVNPVATDDSFIGFEDIAFVIQANQLLTNDADPDASGLTTLTVDAVGNASNGTVILQADGSVRFNPTANFYGTASFQYRSNDGEGGQTWATAYLNVQAVNDAPVITNIWYASGDDSTVAVMPISFEYGDITYFLQDDPYRQNGGVVAYDPDGDSSAITLSISGGPQHGHAWANVVVPSSAPAFMTHDAAPAYFTPQAGAWQYFSHQGDSYSGADPFTVTVTDAQGASTTATVTPTHQGSSAGGGGAKPVSLDLNGNGLEYIGIDDSQAYFDVNSDGWRERLAWVSSDDGWLVRDIGADRVIDRFDEISFTGYLPGAKTDLEGLQAFDSNGDGLLSRLDKRWQEFGVWQDGNGNGASDAGEVRTLDEIGIVQIGLSSDQQMRQVDGVTEFGQSRFVWGDGRTGAVGDVALPVDAGARLPASAAASAPVPSPAPALEVAQAQTQPAEPAGSTAPSPFFPTPEHTALLMVQMINAFTGACETAALAAIEAQGGHSLQQALADTQAQWEQSAQSQALQFHGASS